MKLETMKYEILNGKSGNTKNERKGYNGCS